MHEAYASKRAVCKYVIKKLTNTGQTTTQEIMDETGCTRNMVNRLAVDWENKKYIERIRTSRNKESGGCYFVFVPGVEFANVTIPEKDTTVLSKPDRAFRKTKAYKKQQQAVAADSPLCDLLHSLPSAVAKLWLDGFIQLEGKAGALSVATTDSIDGLLYALWHKQYGFNRANIDRFNSHHKGLWCLFMIEGEIHGKVRL